MFSNQKIQGRLLIVTGIVLLLGVVIIGWSLYSIVNLDALGNRLVALDQEGSDALEAGNGLSRIALADLSYNLAIDERYAQDHIVQRAIIGQYLAEAQQRSTDAAIRDLLRGIEDRLPDSDENWNNLYVMATVEETYEDANLLSMQSADLMHELKRETGKIYSNVEEQLDAVKSEADFAYYAAFGGGAAAVLVFLILAVVAAGMITRSINRPLICLIDAAEAMEKGEFDPAILDGLTDRPDEIGRIARSMLEMSRDVEARRSRLIREASQLRAKLA